MEQHISRAKIIAHLMDRQFRVGKFQFGLDPILGIIPGLGDIVGLMFALYIYYIAHQIGVSRWHKAQIIYNVVVDFLIGLIPVLGDLFDVEYKANYRNYKIIERYRRGTYLEGEVVEEQ